MRFKYKLGLYVEDKITEFEGIIVSRIQYLYGCNQYGVKSRELHEDKPVDTIYFDEGRIVVLYGGIDEKDVQVKDDPGCENHPDAPKK